MKIGIVCRSSLGGSGISATSIAEGLAKKGHEIHMITHGRPFRLEKNSSVTIHKIPIKTGPIFSNFPETLSIASKIAEIVEKEDLDIINVHYAIPYSVAVYLVKQMLNKKKKRIKIITTVHGTDMHTYGKRKEFKEVLRFALDENDGIIAVSNFMANKALELGIKSRVKVIPNFVNKKKFSRKGDKKSSEFRKKFAPNGEKIILHTSNLRKIKRVEDILRAFNLIKSKIKVKLIIVGSGPERKKLINLVKRLKLDKKVFFVGSLKRVERYFEISDLFVMASENEGMPMSILEAMAMEVPVVSTKVGGIPEQIEDGINGLLVEKEETKELSEAMLKVLSNNELARRMTKKGLEKFNECFTEQKSIKSYENYYKEVLFLN
jgi:N-acetyl-alpha-D-glucosaminyl L-malate synthase BshA